MDCKFENKIVSICIALCNNKKTLKKCLDSVLRQSFKNIEIIVVDDGSVDSPKTVIDDYNDSRLKYYLKENGGLSSARQYALNIATGEFICFIDADDYLEESFVELLLNNMVRNEADVCVCSTNFINEKGAFLENETHSYSNDRFFCEKISIKDLSENGTEIIGRYLLSDSWNKMYRTAFLKKSDLKFNLPKGYNGSDLLFNHKMIMHMPRICSIKERVYNHVIYAKSAVHRKNKKLLDGFSFIFKDIISEADRLQLTGLLSGLLSCLYVRFLRKIVQDEFEESCGIFLKYRKLRELKKSSYIDLQKMLPCNIEIKELNTSSMKLFWFLFNYFPFGLLLYLMYRKKKLAGVLS